MILPQEQENRPFLRRKRTLIVQGRRKKGRMTQLKQSNVEKVYPLCKDLSANPYHEMLAGELCLPSSKYIKKMLYLDKRTIGCP
jgi:hypothetical protein